MLLTEELREKETYAPKVWKILKQYSIVWLIF